MAAPTTFQRAVESRDLEAVIDALAPDVVFRSPVVYKPYEGRELVSVVLGAAVRVFEDFEYVRRIESDDGVALIFKARVGDRQLDGLDLLRFDDDGLITELTVMVRPMSGVHALAAAMGEELERMGVVPPNGGGELMAIERVGVLGCGLMGHGIAQICAEAGWDVVVREVDQGRLDSGLGKIEKQLARAVEKGRREQGDADAVRARITGTLEYGDLADCDLAIEAIVEDLDGKLEMWREVDGVVKKNAFFATNTSSLPVVNQAVATSRPERFLGMHFFNPAQVMPLLEVVQTVTTGEEALRTGFESARSWARRACTRATRRASSSTGCSCPTCSMRFARRRRESARSTRSTSR